MPPKKRDKDGESSKNHRSEAAKTDHDLFLQAFEKPTQIYRYLRVRNANSPIFLQRNLSYMLNRMSRSHKSRQTFEINSILDKVTKSLVPAALRGGFMTITFLGFYDKKPGDSPKDPVKVETLLLKICHKKRKDTTTPVMTVTIGTSIVPTNPSEESPPPKAPTVSLSVDEFCEEPSEVKSYHLLLRVYNISNNGQNGASNLDSDTSEPAPKRRRTSTSRDDLKLYGTDLVVYDRQKQCLLGDGDYELLMDEVAHPRNLSRKFPSWEQIGDISERVFPSQDCNSFELFSNGPTLKFKLEWSREQRSSFVDRPRLMPAKEEEVLDNNGNKENKEDRAAKKQAGEKRDDDRKITMKPVVVYQFHYNNNSRQQTEPVRDLHCPWCSLDCGTLYSLLKHLKLCHARFTFTYTPLSNMARIDVAINESYDGSYTGSPHDVIAQPGGSAFSRNGPQIRTSVSNILVCHPKRQKPSLSEFMELEEESGDLQRSFIVGHNRLYHHTVTCLPVHPKEMENDSEGENDPKWLQTKTMMMIDEFTDVNEGEKELMKMWNLHVMKEGYVGDCQVPLACSKFLEKKGEELLEKNLYRNFVVHLCSLFDYGLLSPVALYQTMQQLHEMISDKHAKIMQSSWEAQKEHWIKSGAKEKQNTPSHFKTQSSCTVNADPNVRRKLYSPGSFKSESPSRRTTQQQDDDEEEEDDDEEEEDEEEEEESEKVEIPKSSCSSSSRSSTSSDSGVTKKKSSGIGSEMEKKKSSVAKSGSTTTIGCVSKSQTVPTKHPAPVVKQNPKGSTSETGNGETAKRKAPSSRGTSPTPGCSKLSGNVAPTLNSAKSVVSNEPAAKKKIVVSHPNGKPQAVSSMTMGSSSDMKRKSISSIAPIAPQVSGNCTDSTKVIMNGTSQQSGSRGTSVGPADAKKRQSLPTLPSSGAKNTNSSITSNASQNVEVKKKPLSNGLPAVDDKLVSNCTVEMVSIVDDIILPSCSKPSVACGNDTKRKSSLGQNPGGVSSGQGDITSQRRKSISDSASAPDAGVVLLRRKSFSSNQSTDPTSFQTIAPKGMTS